mgnify:FL=1
MIKAEHGPVVMREAMPPLTQLLMDAAALTLRFARVPRATRHEDGLRAETDSDHTVMLTVLACAYAAQHAPHLSLGKIAQYAAVHDLVEAYAGDVLSLGMSADTRHLKEIREHEALKRIASEFAHLPWIAATIFEYEQLASEEARYVKIFDKVLPKLTHLLNSGAALREHGFSYEKAHADHLRQRAQMAREYPQADALAVFDAVISTCADQWGLTLAEEP